MFGRYKDLKERLESLESQIEGLHEQVNYDTVDNMRKYWGGGVYPSLRGDVDVIKEYLGISTEYQAGKVAAVKNKKGKK